MEELSLTEDKQNSITLKKDSKGNYNWEIKLYFNDKSLNAIDKINMIDKKLRKQYGKED